MTSEAVECKEDVKKVLDPRNLKRDHWHLPSAEDVRTCSGLFDRKDLFVFFPFPQFRSSEYCHQTDYQRSAVLATFREITLQKVPGIEVFRDNISPFQVLFQNNLFPLASYFILFSQDIKPERIIEVFSEGIAPRLRTSITKSIEWMQERLETTQHRDMHERSIKGHQEFLKYDGQEIMHLEHPEQDQDFLNACTNSIHGSRIYNPNIEEIAVALTAIYGGQNELRSVAARLSNTLAELEYYKHITSR